MLYLKSNERGSSYGKQTYRFHPENILPETIRRGREIPISGWIRTRQGHSLSLGIVVLRLHAGLREESWTVHTDSDGYFHVNIQLAPDWPVGETTMEWEYPQD